ncbi:winged helix-turn-helix domain-containing protein [Halorarum salinum]|uniref:Winged helix-turn-helix transcriptional regulator n=1 Tax=Halorarum salinum TaxID=2743089 RepID=A0A7D5QBQ2_9EURY|nr:winged helix-turn-helix domain-containing protein [Halobaculum salinum]QLG61081.1 winged helix-turn-helix transcriptional regulator [Halobaculum salinum]
MPIDIETFDHRSASAAGETHAQQIVRFLARNDDSAFERREIAEATGIDPNSVSAVLSRLKERGLVRHKPPYWAIGDRERIATASDFSRSLEALNEQLGAEEMDEWRSAGADTSNSSDDESADE